MRSGQRGRRAGAREGAATVSPSRVPPAAAQRAPSPSPADEVEDLIEAWSPYPAPEGDPGRAALDQERLRLPDEIVGRYRIVPSKQGQDLFRTNGEIPGDP